MSSKYNVCPLFWDNQRLKNMVLLEKLLNDGWKIIRVDTMSPTNFPSDTGAATSVYVLEKQSEEKQSEDTKKSSVLKPLPHDMGLRMEFLPHDMGLRMELDTNETYYLQSGWKECDGSIYGFACGHASSGNQYYAECTTWFKESSCIAIMSSHVKLVVPFDESKTETTNQTEDAKE